MLFIAKMFSTNEKEYDIMGRNVHNVLLRKGFIDIFIECLSPLPDNVLLSKAQKTRTGG